MVRPFRVGFDARWISESGSGVSVYSRELLRGLLRCQNDLRFVPIFASDSVRDRILDSVGDAPAESPESVVVQASPTGFRSQRVMPSLIRRLDLDVYHSPEFVVPYLTLAGSRTGGPAIITTIHDVIPLSVRDACPRSYKERFRPFYRAALRAVVHRADGVLTVSRASRREIVRLLGVPDSRVHVVHNGVSRTYSPSDTEGRARPQEILYVGRQDPYKGVATLVSAFAELRYVHGVDARLVIVGSPDPRYPEAAQMVQGLGVGEQVDWLGFLDMGELLAAYRRASVLVLPSHYEGFGLPVLEAMACGTPVVCTRAGGLPEAAGEAADYVTPGDVQELGRALARVLTDKQHAARLVRLGLDQAARFSWDRAAEQTIAVYRQLLEGR